MFDFRTMAIDRFEGDYRFLSNFWFREDGFCVEVHYQAAKCADPDDRKIFIDLLTTEYLESSRIVLDGERIARKAKRKSRYVTLRSDWTEELKLQIMKDLVLRKYSVEPLRTKLTETFPAVLSEGNWWGDRFWGVDLQGRGEDHLGKITMWVRDTLIVEDRRNAKGVHGS